MHEPCLVFWCQTSPLSWEGECFWCLLKHLDKSLIKNSPLWTFAFLHILTLKLWLIFDHNIFLLCFSQLVLISYSPDQEHVASWPFSIFIAAYLGHTILSPLKSIWPKIMFFNSEWAFKVELECNCFLDQNVVTSSKHKQTSSRFKNNLLQALDKSEKLC